MKGLEGSVFREGKHHRWSDTGSGRRAEMGLGVVQKQLEGNGRVGCPNLLGKVCIS